MDKPVFLKDKKKYFIELSFKLGIIVVLIIADIATKVYFANRHAQRLGDMTVIPRILSFTYTRNTGAAFGIFGNSTLFLTIASAVFIIGFFVADMFFHNKNGWYVASFTLIVGGAIGNFIDRAFLGYVRDFIRFDFINFAIFNLADVFLTIGLICYCIWILFFVGKKDKVVTKK